MAIQTITAAELLALIEADRIEWPPVTFAGNIYAIKKPELGDLGRILYRV